MRSWERALSVLEVPGERGRAAGHGWTLDTELLPPRQQQVNALESQCLVELADREDRVELAVLGGAAHAVGGPPDAVRPRPSPTAGRAGHSGIV